MSATRDELDPELLRRSAFTSIGLFNVSEGSLIVSDPRYEVNPRLNWTIPNATPGDWFGVVKVAPDHCIAELIEFSVDTTSEAQRRIAKESCAWKEQKQLVVDSAKMGIFDAKLYRTNGAVDLDAGVMTRSIKAERWFAHCAHITKRANSIFGVAASTMPGGVVSCSGGGDGIYVVSTLMENDLVCAVKIEFD